MCRYPFYASEIFTCDVSSITEQFLTEVNLNDSLELKEEQKGGTAGENGETTLSATEQSEEAAKVEDDPKPEQSSENKAESKDAPVPEETPISHDAFADKEKLTEEAVNKESETKEKEESQGSDNNPMPEEKPIAEEEFASSAAKEAVTDKSSEAVQSQEVLEVKPLPESSESTNGQKNSEDGVLQETPERPKVPRYALLEKLLSLLSTNNEINSVLAGYFFKVFNAILERHTNEVLTYLFYYKEHIGNILRHSYNKSISEVLNKLAVPEDRAAEAAGELAEGKRELLLRVVEKMGPENSMDAITNSCYTLCSIADSKQRLEYFFGKEFLEKMFEYARSDNWMSLRGALTLLIVLYRVKASSGSTETPAFSGFAIADDMNEEELPDFTETLKMSVEYLDFAKQYLKGENRNPKLATASGNLLVPFGLDRLKVIEWIHALIGLKEESVGKKLCELDMGSVLLSLMMEYDMNSILDNKVFVIFKAGVELRMPIYTEAVFCFVCLVHH
eukprot:TRINITY_DN8264_c0_g1_i3.p1 TRINITY_DN8264_c0_g1~~TRINITY_DN8264_c0_g1_i3.p1  ORF type:complete len:505 (-),score=170.09 TRINITY_DN8264_c0_g1_i3:600-2114(-)